MAGIRYLERRRIHDRVKEEEKASRASLNEDHTKKIWQKSFLMKISLIICPTKIKFLKLVQLSETSTVCKTMEKKQKQKFMFSICQIWIKKILKEKLPRG